MAATNNISFRVARCMGYVVLRCGGWVGYGGGGGAVGVCVIW